VVEDVVTSGGQVVASTGDLRDARRRGRPRAVRDRPAGGRPDALAADRRGAAIPLFTMAELKAAAAQGQAGSAQPEP
jgi:orotate phosphoribosyltransferase